MPPDLSPAILRRFAHAIDAEAARRSDAMLHEALAALDQRQKTDDLVALLKRVNRAYQMAFGAFFHAR